MKRNNRNIIYTWVLLLFFIAGQYLAFTHTHYKQGSIATSTKSGLPVLKEKCDVCAVMHHSHMLLTQHVYFTPAIAVLCHYQYKKSDITLIQLVLASGRAPPSAIS
ncbi:hypothetical protein [Mucilaginibacter boryungensis]|uniref:Cytochrome c domain-containing protein n=1 Tax=Mucilaginibacter boryungensis TaxID=768480 RepID=A0ABR9XLP2_9SPHI|nr:hypothetical protein [Mucilaginibacter boryungensis]MBE9668297.1 hypothetical protein [Mucilaginibacter boryungensis]